jgi:hypothetical protein
MCIYKPDMPKMKSILFLLIAVVALQACQQGGDSSSEFLAASWDREQLDPVLGKTMHLHLDPALDGLSDGEKEAVSKLLEVGHLFHELYLESRHPESLGAGATLVDLQEQAVDPERTAALLDLYRMMMGPITTTLDNRRVPFLPVAEEEDGKNVYPQGSTRAEMDEFLAANPDRRDEILHLRSVVRQATKENAERDLAALDEHAVLDASHQGLREKLESVRDNPSEWGIYAVPYSVAYADRILRARVLLEEAAAAVEAEDPDFGAYLRHRAGNLLVDDYEQGDAAWVTGQFTGNLNAAIGSYETYDDGLYGVKSFFGLSLLLRDRERSDELAKAVAGIQKIEDALPYEHHQKVRENIPVGVYSVIADFGQSRGTNTATILPNESHISRKYGRTILIRANILMNPRIFANALRDFKEATIPDHHDELSPEGNLNYTLWHEIGHYLGVDQTSEGRELDEVLEDTADILEELKADLVSLFAAGMLREQGLFNDADLRAVYARGIDRVLLKNRPRRTQPYGTMQLMQWNWYLDRGLLRFDRDTGLLSIDYSLYPETVTSMLAEVLKLQYAGDRGSAQAFIDQWTRWVEDLHGVTAGRMKAAERFRYSLVTYGVMNEKPHTVLSGE